MPIPQNLLDRIEGAPINGRHMADLFTKAAYVLDQAAQDAITIDIAYVTEADQLQPGDLIPTLTLALRRSRPAAVVVAPNDAFDVEPQP